MKRKLVLVPVLLSFLFLFTLCEKNGDDPLNLNSQNTKKSDHVNGTCYVVQELWAGAGKNDVTKGTLVGDVKAEIVGDDLIIHYKVNSPWLLSEAHLWVGTEMLDIPRQAAPGRFPYKKDLAFKTATEFVISLSDLGINPDEDVIYIAAHGVVNYGPGDVENICKNLPESVNFSLKFPGTSSYFIGNILGSSFISGAYNAWCIETDQRISQAKEYSAKVYCSYETLPEELIDYPENLDLVNWLINQDFIGMSSSDCDGDYTRGDIQTAIWTLLTSNPEEGVDQGPFSQCRVDELVAAAYEYGEGFKPECGDLMILLLLPDEEVQNIAFEFPVLCGGNETVWAYGDYEFDDYKISNKWGWIFDLNCNLE